MNAADNAVLTALRQPVEEVWIRLRPPTLLEQVGRGLAEDIAPSDELLKVAEYIVNAHAERTGEHSTADLQEAAEALIAMLADVIDDREATRDVIRMWAEEWSIA